ATGRWLSTELSNAIARLEQDGHQPRLEAQKKRSYFGLPQVHIVPKDVSDGRRKYYYFFRPTGDPLPGLPGAPEFMRALIAHERALALLQPRIDPKPSLRKLR